MAHYAKLDENNIVLGVIVIDNQKEITEGAEDENKGIAFCAAITGHNKWIKTSYNSKIRKRYAGIGYRYDELLDAFINPQPFASWTLNAEADWIPPVPKPDDDPTKKYRWNENTLSWDTIEDFHPMSVEAQSMGKKNTFGGYISGFFKPIMRLFFR